MRFLTFCLQKRTRYFTFPRLSGQMKQKKNAAEAFRFDGVYVFCLD